MLQTRSLVFPKNHEEYIRRVFPDLYFPERPRGVRGLSPTTLHECTRLSRSGLLKESERLDKILLSSSLIYTLPRRVEGHDREVVKTKGISD